MKVVIACLNSKFVHASLSPWCLLSGVRAFVKKPCDAVVLESTINGDMAAFAQKIIAEKPTVVAFSCYIWNITQTLELCRMMKEFHDCKIVLGGPEVAYRSREVLCDYPFVDFVLSGEGEWSFPAFLDALHGDLSSVSGLTYRNGDDTMIIPETEQTETPPSPYCDEFFEKLSGRIAYIETARGCPYRCAFCLSGRCSPLRFFDLAQVKRDILRLANSGTQTIKFVDRTFNANTERANEILRFIKERYGKEIPKTVCFHFEMAGDILRESTLALLASMPYGAVQLEIGMQSFNESVLKTIHRQTNTQKLIENIKKLIGFNNMHIHIDLIAGLTGEDLKSFANSFNIGYSLKAHMLQMGFLKLLHGADMRENREAFPCTFTEKPPYEVTSTPWLSEAEVGALKRCEDAVDRLYNSGRFLFTLAYLTEEIGIAPFTLFYEFGNAVNGARMQLGDYAEKLFLFFGEWCDKQILKEKILCDLLCSASSVQIPAVLRNEDPLYKKLKRHFTEHVGKHVKIAILSSENKIFAVDQGGAKNLYNRYEGNYYDLAAWRELVE